MLLASAPDPVIARQLVQLEEQLVLTWKNRDCAGWSGLLADDWTVTHINAQVITKAQAVEMCRTGPAVTSSVDDISVRVYGDTAVVTGRTRATATTTPPETVVLRFTDVVVQRDGRWIVVASHATQIQETP